MSKAASKYRALHEKAHAAGLAAGEAAQVPLSVVGTPRNKLASILGGDDGGFDPDKPVYLDTAGPCGFAWITVPNGRSGFAQWARKTLGAHRNYYGTGFNVWVRSFGQSVIRKEAYAAAYAAVLRENDVDAYAGSRLD